MKHVAETGGLVPPTKRRLVGIARHEAAQVVEALEKALPNWPGEEQTVFTGLFTETLIKPIGAFALESGQMADDDYDPEHMMVIPVNVNPFSFLRHAVDEANKAGAQPPLELQRLD